MLRRAEACTRACKWHCARERATYIACTSQTLEVLAILRFQLPVTRLRRRVYQATHERRKPEARGGANINARPLSACSSPCQIPSVFAKRSTNGKYANCVKASSNHAIFSKVQGEHVDGPCASDVSRCAPAALRLSAFLALAPYPLVPAEAPPAALLAKAPSPLVLADARPAALLARAP